MTYKKPHRNGPVQLRDGFYIEVTQEGRKGMKIRSDSKKAMEDIALQYAGFNKTVTLLGEYRGGVQVSGTSIF